MPDNFPKIKFVGNWFLSKRTEDILPSAIDSIETTALNMLTIFPNTCILLVHFVMLFSHILIVIFIEKLFKLNFFSLCVRLTTLQIGTHLKIVPNRYHSHHYNTTDCSLSICVCDPKSTKSVHFSRFKGHI